MNCYPPQSRGMQMWQKHFCCLLKIWGSVLEHFERAALILSYCSDTGRSSTWHTFRMETGLSLVENNTLMIQQKQRWTDRPLNRIYQFIPMNHFNYATLICHKINYNRLVKEGMKMIFHSLPCLHSHCTSLFCRAELTLCYIICQYTCFACRVFCTTTERLPAKICTGCDYQ